MLITFVKAIKLENTIGKNKLPSIWSPIYTKKAKEQKLFSACFGSSFKGEFKKRYHHGYYLIPFPSILNQEKPLEI